MFSLLTGLEIKMHFKVGDWVLLSYWIFSTTNALCTYTKINRQGLLH